MHELGLALRRVTSRPVTTIVSVATLACAIGATAVTWSAISAVLIHPLPVRDPQSLLVVGARESRGSGTVVRHQFIYPAFLDVRASGVFERPVAQWGSPHTLLVDAAGSLQRADVGFATHDFFSVLGVDLALGRGFRSDEDRRGAAPVALLTHRYWRRAFNESPEAIGRSIRVAGTAVTVIGVLQRGFRGVDLSESLDLYLPFHTIADIGGPDTNYFAEPNAQSSPTAGTMILGRLRAGVSPAQAIARLTTADRAQPRRDPPPHVVLQPADVLAVPQLARFGMVRFARLLAATVGLLLAIGCTTIGMLLLIRTEARSAEFAMCMALGASRGRLARGVVCEGALLSAAGALAAVPAASGLFALVRGFQLPGNVSIDSLELAFDRGSVVVAAAAAVAAVIIVAAIAGVSGFRSSVADALRSRAGVTRRTTGAVRRTALVGTQVAIAVVLVTGAGLFARSVSAAIGLNPDVDMERLVIGTVELRSHGYTPERATEFFERLRERLKVNPAVESITLSVYSGGMTSLGKLEVDGEPRQFPSTVWFTRIDEDYFRAYGMTLAQGRAFTRDDSASSPPVAIVSESYGRQLASGGSPLGHAIRVRPGTPPVRVVGVVSDIVSNVTVLEPLAVYLPSAQGPPLPYRDIVVHATTSASDARREILAAIRELDPVVMPTPLRTFEDRFLQQMAAQELGATVLGALGALAVLLTLLGIYVLADSMATMRMREISIRAALGASSRQLGTLAFAETARLVGVGLAAGLFLAWLGAGTIRSFLFQVKPLDPLTLAIVSLSMFVLAVAVTLRSAVRMSRVDIAGVLKAD